MTVEREAMTLADASTRLRLAIEYRDTGGYDGRSLSRHEMERMADAIDAALSRAVEPVAFFMSTMEADSVDANARLGNDATATVCTKRNHPDDVPLYAHPPEPARDARRWQKVRRMGVFKPGNPSDCKFVFNDEADAVVDAAMARESGDAN